MKNKHIALTLLLGTAIFTSCSDDIEKYNENPNSPEVVPTSTIFNSATKEYTDFMRNGFNSGRLVLPWLQYWGQTSYADEDRYDYRETTAESIYQNTYLVATDLKKILDLNTNEATRDQQAANGNNDNQIAASRIMLAYMFHKLTDTFGDVPYYSYGTEDPDFQALQVDNVLSPVFAPQEKIYADILLELKAASDMINTSEPVFNSGDNIFNGDAVKWKKFANSLILRVANRLRDVNPGTANAAIDAALAAGVMESNADNAVQAYEAADATASPFWVAFITRTDFAVTNTFVRVLKGESGNFGLDPRLFEYAAPSTVSITAIKDNSYERSEDPSDYQGVPYAFAQTQRLPFDTYTFPSSNIIKPDYGEVLMEYAEVQFIISEHNGFSQAEYEEGVRASMGKWGVASDDIDAFVSSLPAASEETVLNQKWVALYMQAHEAWAEYRRTGFPSLLKLPGATIELAPNQVAALPEESRITSYVFEPRIEIDDLPKRLRYPQILQTLNGENRKAAVTGLSDGDTVNSALFWDVN
jgi:hypothetical protein